MGNSRDGALEHLEEVVCLLQETHGSPRHGNKDDPLDELVYIILSNRTRQEAAQAGFDALLEAFGSWPAMAEANRRAITSVIRHLGLARVKSTQLLEILARLKADFGDVSLTCLGSWSTAKAEAYLVSLPGVSKKVAKCVLMYSLGRSVLPVDVHVHRVAARLGLPAKQRPDTSQDAIEGAVPEELRYSFHVNALAHGREYCRSSRPRCGACCVREYCATYRTGEAVIR